MKKINLSLVVLSCMLFSTNLFANTTTQNITNNKQDTLTQNENILSVEKIEEKIIPYIVYGTMKENVGFLKKGDKVEIYQDTGNGKRYEVKKDDKSLWVKGNQVSIIKNPVVKVEDIPQLTNEELEFYMNNTNKTSKTNFYIWTDLHRERIYVFKKVNNTWKLEKNILCSSGKDTTPTIRGYFEITDRGKQFGKDYKCYNWVRIQDDYLFHSVVYNNYGKVIDSNLGKKVSNGCIRMETETSKWFYDTMTKGTAIWIN